MKKTPFQSVLTRIDVRARLIHQKCEEIRILYGNGDIIGAYDEALKLEEVSEHLTLFARALPAYTGNPNADYDVKNLMKELIPVDIGFTEEGWFSVRIPMLLPKKAHGSADYVRSFLYPAMQTFFEGKSSVRYRDCVLIYRHVYDINRPERKMRDHDNIEINMVSDIIALYVMPDDGPEVCSHYYCSAAGAKERTEVYVVPKNEFWNWLKSENNMPEEGAILYENTKKSPENLMSKEAKTTP